MQALVQLIDRYRPGFADDVKPAPADVVDELSKLAGPLPGAYRRFLATMGGSMGEFEPLGGNFDVYDRVMNYQLDSGCLAGSTHLLIAAGDVLEPGGDLFLDRSEPYGKDDCLLVIADCGPSGDRLNLEARKPIHAGLEECLYVEAYRDFRLPLLTLCAECALATGVKPSAAISEQVLRTAKNLGFSRVPPATRSVILERGDAAMVFYRDPHSERFLFQIGADRPEELLRMVDVFANEVPLRRVR